jgi:chromosome segregation ATPase
VADPLGSSAPADGGLEERLAELDRETEALAEQVERVQAERWEQSGTLASTGEAISALALLWRGVDAAVEALRAAERTLREVRGR